MMTANGLSCFDEDKDEDVLALYPADVGDIYEPEYINSTIELLAKDELIKIKLGEFSTWKYEYIHRSDVGYDPAVTRIFYYSFGIGLVKIEEYSGTNKYDRVLTHVDELVSYKLH